MERDFDMERRNTIAPHETLELHELITIKNISATKSYAMSALVKDEELKQIMLQDFRVSQEQIRELSDLLKQSGFKNPPSEAPGIPSEETGVH